MTTLASSTPRLRENAIPSAPRPDSLLGNWLSPMVFSTIFGYSLVATSENGTRTANSDAELDSASGQEVEEHAGRDGSRQNERQSSLKPISSHGSVTKTEKKPTTKTKYAIAHPPPVVGPRRVLHTKPKLLLQLQRLSASGRPSPTFDVVPFSALASKSARKLPSSLKPKPMPPGTAFAVVKAEEYERPIGEAYDTSNCELENESWEPSSTVGVIHHPNDGEGVSISLDNGATWTARRLNNGNYEFVSPDGMGQLTTFRWIMRVSNGEIRYKFSPIDPRSRKHPILACLDQSEIAICDTFRVPPSPGPTPGLSPSSSPGLMATTEDPFFGSPSLSGSTHDSSLVIGQHDHKEDEDFTYGTTEQMRLLITVSGVCLTFMEGWLKAFRGELYQQNLNGDMSSSSSLFKQPTSSSDASSSPKPRRTAFPKRFASVDITNMGTSDISSGSITTAGTAKDESALARSNSVGVGILRPNLADRRVSLQWPKRKPSERQAQLQEDGEEGSADKRQPPGPQDSERNEVGPPVVSVADGPSMLRSAEYTGQACNQTVIPQDPGQRRKGGAGRLATGMKRLMHRKSTRK